MKNNAMILIVDDEEKTRKVLRKMMPTLGHTPILANNGISAINEMRNQSPDIVLLDILMPGMSGYQVLETMKKEEALCHIPVIVLTAVSEIESAVRCLEMGADDYMNKPFKTEILKAKIKSLLEKQELRKLSAFNEVSFALAGLAESRDPETGEHLCRMAEYCKILCDELCSSSKNETEYKKEIDSSFIENLRIVAQLHDIGKVGIMDGILLKPGKHNDKEFEIMKDHTIIGTDCLINVLKEHPKDDLLLMGIDVALCHHEKWDGTGYPDGLKDTKIPLSARILALADVYDAVTSKRCYKQPVKHVDCVKIIKNDSGKHFDPKIVEAFEKTENKFNDVIGKYAEVSTGKEKWLKSHSVQLKNYAGKYIGVVENEIVANGNFFIKVLKEAMEQGNVPVIYKVSTSGKVMTS